jgi:hypothetical protein
MKAKAIIACLCLLISSHETANGAFIRQKFVFDDAEEEKLQLAKSQYEQQLAHQAEQAKQEQEMTDILRRQNDIERQEAEQKEKDATAKADAVQNKTLRSTIAHVPLKNINN